MSVSENWKGWLWGSLCLLHVVAENNPFITVSNFSINWIASCLHSWWKTSIKSYFVMSSGLQCGWLWHIRRHVVVWWRFPLAYAALLPTCCLLQPHVPPHRLIAVQSGFWQTKQSFSVSSLIRKTILHSKNHFLPVQITSFCVRSHQGLLRMTFLLLWLVWVYLEWCMLGHCPFSWLRCLL